MNEISNPQPNPPAHMSKNKLYRAGQKIFTAHRIRTKRLPSRFTGGEDTIEDDFHDFLRFNQNDFMFLNSTLMEAMVLKERSFTLVLLILNFLAIMINVLVQEVFFWILFLEFFGTVFVVFGFLEMEFSGCVIFII